jgi:hypothetical protein
MATFAIVTKRELFTLKKPKNVKKRHTNYTTPKCEKLSFIETQSMCVSFDQIIGDKGKGTGEPKGEHGKRKEKGRVQTFNISLGLACKKGDAIVCGVRSHIGHICKQLWSRL